MEPSEEPLRNRILNLLFRRLGEPGTLTGSGPSLRFLLRAKGGVCEAEGSLDYKLPDRTVVEYSPDILFTLDTGRMVAVELKFISSVPDQFKARSFNAMHVKGNHGRNVHFIMAYVHLSGSGVSSEIARSYCYPFDQFIGFDLTKPDDLSEAISKIAARVEGVVETIKGDSASSLDGVTLRTFK